MTPREAQVLRLVAEGLPGKHIATRLQLSQQTSNGHLRSIYRKANATGRGDLLGQFAWESAILARPRPTECRVVRSWSQTA